MVDRARLILPAEVTKGRMARAPDMPKPVTADLARWRLACGGLGGLVFPRPTDGRRWTKSDWDNWRKRGFVKAARTAGLQEWDSDSETWVDDFRPYGLRHTCASLMIRAHVGPGDVAAQLGTSLELVFRTHAHSIEAMRGRPSTSIAEARTELRGRLRGDLHRLPGPRVAALARWPGDGGEFAKAGEFHLVASRELSGDLLDRRLHCRLRLALLEPRPRRHLLSQLVLGRNRHCVSLLI
jgi:hypothetical protein